MKQKGNHTHILFRYVLILAIILLFSSMICFRMFKTTVIDAHHWNELARRQLEKVDTIYPDRGDILASDGSILATNLNYYTLRIDFRCDNFKDKALQDSLPMLADSLAKYFPQYTSAQWKERIGEQIAVKYKDRKRAWPLLSNISYLDLQRVKSFPFFNIGNSNKTGLTIEKRMRRCNPYGAMAKRSVGGVGQTEESKEIHGIYGLEKALDTLLYGQVGLTKKVNLTKDIVNWTDVPPQPGYNVQTTIDIQMQDIVETELNRVLDSCAADWGCAVLMEVKTGEIKAISNLERSKNGNGYIEALNYSVVGFEPGSVVKPISMMIALEDGLVNNLEEVIPIGSSWAYAGGRPITDSHFNSALRVREVIEQSSNIGMARIITRGYHNNPKGFVERLRGIGFLDPMNTGIAGERAPRFKEDPGRVDLSRMCYGYASEIPPLYTLSIYNAIANDGRYVRPHLVKGLHTENFDSILPITYIRDRICSEQNAKKMQYMLTQVVEGPHGTGRRLKNDKVRLAGKTGTCYSVNPTTRQYDKGRKRLAFCGFFPADNPKYSCMVLTYYPKRNMMGAASTSGQVLKNIALKMYSRGMLDNASDYAADHGELGAPLTYGSIDPQRYKQICKAADLSLVKHPATPQPTPGGVVPSVLGLGLREAVVMLENKGYNVKFEGAGYVRSQQPDVGTKLAKGSTVEITLAP